MHHLADHHDGGLQAGWDIIWIDETLEIMWNVFFFRDPVSVQEPVSRGLLHKSRESNLRAFSMIYLLSNNIFFIILESYGYKEEIETYVDTICIIFLLLAGSRDWDA